jgi:hypothetical protein
MPDFGELADEAKKLAGEHSDQVQQGMDKAADFADQKTGGRFSDQIKDGEQQAENYMGDSGQNQ